MKHMDPSAFVNAVPLEKPKMTLRDLSALLRDRDSWPRGFVWDYADVCHCAMGLVMKYDPTLEQEWKSGIPSIHVMANYFNIDLTTSRNIFWYAHRNSKFFGLADGDIEEVKPQRVAKLIDRYLAKAA